MLGGYCSHNPLYPPYFKGDIEEKPQVFEWELAEKTELLRSWKSRTVTSVK
jgi:hypothetical protein